VPGATEEMRRERKAGGGGERERGDFNAD
jgi:hypothetical protein